MSNKEVEKKIEEVITSVGATGELLGVMRDALIKNGFTREEAVDICAKMIVGMLNNAGGAKE